MRCCLGRSASEGHWRWQGRCQQLRQAESRQCHPALGWSYGCARDRTSTSVPHTGMVSIPHRTIMKDAPSWRCIPPSMLVRQTGHLTECCPAHSDGVSLKIYYVYLKPDLACRQVSRSQYNAAAAATTRNLAVSGWNLGCSKTCCACTGWPVQPHYKSCGASHAKSDYGGPVLLAFLS